MRIGTPESFLKLIGTNDDRGFFAFTQFAKPETFLLEEDKDKRCDYLSPRIVRGFHHWNAETSLCSCGSTDEPSRITGGHAMPGRVSSIFPVIDAYPIGMIIYIEIEWAHEPEEMEYQNFHKNVATNITRTLQEQFRLLIEWEYAHEHLGNNEEMAVCASGILQAVDLPVTIRQWILDNVPNEKVNRFLEGREDAQQRAEIDTIPDLTEEFKEWLLSKSQIALPFNYDGRE